MNEIPSVTQQTKWPCGLYDFGRATRGDTRFFNPSIIARPDGDWLIARRSVPCPPIEIGMNDLVAFRVDKHVFSEMVEVKFPNRYKAEHFEDPRACLMNGLVSLSCTNFQIIKGQPWRGSHQLFAHLNEHWQAVKLGDPVYAMNGASAYAQRGNEKNWLWFDHDGGFYMVYTTTPHQVVHFDKRLKAVTTYATTVKDLPWSDGIPRGGSPPIRAGGEYWSFFHSSVPWTAKKRRYFMGAYAFAAKPPFGITRLTPYPLLSGSQKDPWSPGLPLTVFPCGALLRGKIWTVVFGVNDFTSGWIEIPHDDLLKQTVSVSSSDAPMVLDVMGKPMNGDGTYPPEPELDPVAV